MTDYTLTADTAARLLRMLSWWERNPQQGASGTVEIEKEVPNVQEVLLDDPIESHVDGSYTYNAGKVVVFNVGSGDYDEYGTVWLIEVNSRSLVGGEIYTALQSGYRNPSSAGERVVFITGQPCCP